MINIQDDEKVKCCGCSACVQVCPQKCIKMEEDSEGFLYPYVDEDKCVKCDLCEKVCPICQKDKHCVADRKEPRAIGGWHIHDDVREKSSSGGGFTLFAEHILKQGGIVYGCALDKDMKAVHASVENISDLDRLRGSKYVQSDITGIYDQVKRQLNNGRKVLFMGTPCQAAGLHSFLKGERDGLYICDFICHGVPSPKVFKSYIDSLEEMYGSKVIEFKFRNKDKGWHSSGLQMGTKIEFEDGQSKRMSPAFRDAFMNGFLDDIYLRPSCYKCEFKSIPKYYSDITVADFWGVSGVDKELYDKKGTSLLLLNTSKGEALFDEVKSEFFWKECDYRKAIKKNSSLVKSVSWNEKRTDFFEDYEKLPYKIVEKKHMNFLKWAAHKVMKMAWHMVVHVIRLILQPVLKVLKIEWTEENWKSFFQFIKFALVGVSNSAVSYAINISILLLLSSLHFEYDYMIANVSGFALSVLWSYYWNNRYVFTLKNGEKRSRLKTLLKTYAVYGLSGIVLNNILSTIWIKGIGISRFLAPLFNLPVTVPVNFIMNKLWAYRANRKNRECK